MIDSTIVKAHRCSGGAKGGPGFMLLVAAKVAGQTPSTSPAHDRRNAGGGEGSVVSLNGLVKDQFVQCQIRYRLAETGIFPFKVF